jgi:glycosyltransferase involved in cell wall biosynthesis
MNLFEGKTATARNVDVLYLSTEGLLQPIGRSQVYQLLLGLARRGFRYSVLTFERPEDLSDATRVQHVAACMRDAGIEWRYLRYEQGAGAIRIGIAIVKMMAMAIPYIWRRRVRFVHARGSVVAGVALVARAVVRAPFIYDIRGYLIDERLEEGRWFTNPLSLRVGRAIERSLFRHCAAVVSLTEIAAADVRAGRLGALPPTTPISVIPTCTDYDAFRGRSRTTSAYPAASHLHGKLRVGLIGSINRSYRTLDALRIFKYLSEIRDDAHIVCITRQVEPMRILLQAAAIPPDALTLTTADYSEMPRWLGEIDWGLHILDTTFAKRASMPTKLAEFLACGVRPVHHGCNDEVTSWVERCGSGYVLPSLHDEELRRAARFIAHTETSPRLLEHARRVSQPHFGLHAALDRYAELLTRLLSHPRGGHDRRV